MIRTTKVACLSLLLFAAHDVSARIATKNGESEFGRIAEVDELMNLEVGTEDQLFWFRSLQGSMSMSMSMSMAMEPMAIETMVEKMAVEGATGESSGVSTAVEDSAVEAVEATESTTINEAAETPLEPLTAAVDDSESSAAKVVVGLSCVVGVMGILLL